MLDPQTIRTLVRRALDEDLPDITSEAIFDAAERGTALFVAKSPGVVAGFTFADMTFAEIDNSATFTAHLDDGATVEPGQVVAEVNASVVTMLSGERTALNFLQRASGVATATRQYVDAVRGTRATIHDTRKTAPGLRHLDKFAVSAGGGHNHRHGLHDMFLIKNNHIDRAGSIAAAMEKVRTRGLERGMEQKVMIEVRDERELGEALAMAPDFILLDNMSPAQLRAAVERTAGRVSLEASGGITLENVREVAETGVDRISIGALTHSVVAMDISMRIKGLDR